MLITLTIFVGAENEKNYKVGDIIQFGSYPQTEVRDGVLISELNALAPEWENWTSYGYYSGNDNIGSMVQGDWMRYIDVTYGGNKYRAVKFTQYRPINTVYSLSASHASQADSYGTNTVYWFKFEPIDWKVLDPTTGLVMCETIIDAQPYSNTIYRNSSASDIRYAYFNDVAYTNYACDYETSSIRKWLNNDFYNAAFTYSEKKEINTTTLNNDSLYTSFGSTYYEALDSAETSDKIFLLSYNEVTNRNFGFSSNNWSIDADRQAQGSDYARSQGLSVIYYSSNFGSYYWLLRSPGSSSDVCCNVESISGYIPDDIYYVNDVYGVRPALCFNKMSDIGQLEHQHSYISSITTEPTCWRDGVITYTCECGDSYTEAIEKNDHDYNEWKVKTKPTCTKAGLEWSYCLICDSDFEREIPATGHTVIEYVMRATTDEQAAYGGDGAYMTACDVCNEVFKQEFFARPAEYILSTTECTYNGKARKPSVTVKDADGKTLIEGQDYDLIYPDEMKLPGKYNIEVFFKGNYLGGKDLTFTIAPKATTGVKAKTQTTSSITLTWSKTTGATGYRVYQYSPSKEKYVVKASVKDVTTYKGKESED